MDRLLIEVEQRGLKWGVVTNKPTWLTEPLMAALDLTDRATCVISGDTLAQRKPHPEPLLHACALAGAEASQCLYVGDALRDVEAGNAAGMGTVVALYGYMGPQDRPETWPANTMISHPSELLQWLEADGVYWPTN
jgi:phosphoglycolate phosphatase